MNIHENIISYNREEIRKASRSIDAWEHRRRTRAFVRFVLGFVYLMIWSALWAFVLYGWGVA